ncbi:hypothetical protein Tco_1300436 [Tanacetum coccineum]
MKDVRDQQELFHTNSVSPSSIWQCCYLSRPYSNIFYSTNNRLRTLSNTRNQAIIQGDRVNIQSRNSGNAGRNNRRAYVQEEIVEGSNAPNETGNVQRTLRTSSSGNTLAVQCYNCSGKGHYARNSDNTSDVGPSYDSAFISEVQSSSNNENEEQMPIKSKTFLVNIQSKNSGNAGRNNRRAYVPEEIVEGSNAPNETRNVQRTLRTSSSRNTSTVNATTAVEKDIMLGIDKAGVILTDEQNDFLFANICLMARIQQADNTSDAGPSYESAFISEVQSSSNNDQIDSDIIFDSSNGNVNSGSIEKDTHVPDLCALEQLARNAYQEAKKQQIFAQKVQKQNTNLTSQLELYKERVRKSIEIQEGLQARIKILEKDVQRCEKQSVDFELKLQHEKEKQKWDSNLKNKNTKPLDFSWISKMEKLEDENVSLDFTVQALIKERANVKLKYQKLFNSIKKTRSQTQTEIDELIAHVSEKTYAYGAIRAENQNLLFTISELKTRLANAEKGKSVNTKFDKTNGSQPLLCVTPLNKHVIQKKTDVQKSKENHVVSKPVTLQTSPAKQSGVNSNKNVIAPGMYKVATTHESQTNKAKHDLSSTGMNAASSVRRPMNRDSHVKNSVLANSKKPAKKVAVYVRKNKQTDITSENVISNKENVMLMLQTLLKRKLCYVFLVCKITLSTKSRTPKSYDTTYVVHKTRFSKESTLSKSLDTTYVVSKPKIDVESTSKANDKVVQIVLWIVNSGCSKHMTGDRSLLKNFIAKFMGTVRFGNDNFVAITGYGDYIQGNITICHVYYVEGLGHNLFSVGQFCDGNLEVAFGSKTCYVRNLEGDDLLIGGRESNLYTISISDMAASLPVCLMSKATLTKSWLWHCRLSHSVNHKLPGPT